MIGPLPAGGKGRSDVTDSAAPAECVFALPSAEYRRVIPHSGA
ncbi:hypothetical protein LTSEWAN_3480, partial [Salmonella enterica subsp. enterica serovar Wandsworth str. A4-580]